MEQYPQLDLHPESIAYLNYIKKKANLNVKTIEEIRVELNERYKYTTHTDRIFHLKKTEIFVPSPHLRDGIPVHVYTPDTLPQDPPFLVYFHGGAAIHGTRDMVDSVCKILAEDAGCIVLNVEYRLAPEHQSPAQMDDGNTVADWCCQNKQHLGGSMKSKVGVAGDSVGGRIAASVAHDVTLDFQVLVYPYVHRQRSTEGGSFERYKAGPVLTRGSLKWAANMAIPVGKEADPQIAAACRDRFDHLPPALIIVAEHDPYYDSGLDYAEKLRKAGVAVECEVYKGAIHGFFPDLRIYPELSQKALSQIICFIKRYKD